MRRPFALIIPLLLGATAGGAQSSQDAASPRAAEVPLQLTRETATSGVFSTVKGDERAERAEPAAVVPLARVAGRR